MIVWNTLDSIIVLGTELLSHGRHFLHKCVKIRILYKVFFALNGILLTTF